MSEHVKAYPLHWPPGWKRTTDDMRAAAKFNRKSHVTRSRFDGTTYTLQNTNRLSVSDATHRVLDSLERMGLDEDDVVISTNLELRLDGWPRSGQREPDDPGAAVYWRSGKATRCMAIDQYIRVADNLAAIASTLEAMRAIERHGGAAILDRAFTGFTALPAPAQWWHVLGFDTTAGLSLDQVEHRYRELAMQRHPDRGGSADQMAELTWAREQAREQLTT